MGELVRSVNSDLWLRHLVNDVGPAGHATSIPSSDGAHCPPGFTAISAILGTYREDELRATATMSAGADIRSR